MTSQSLPKVLLDPSAPRHGELRSKDRLALTALTLGGGAATAIAGFLGGAPWAALVLALLVGVATVAVVATFRRVQNLVEHHASDYRELEALLSLHACVRLRSPLPPMRGWAISPDFASILVGELLGHRPKVVVELGGGVSTLLGGYCLEQNGGGHLYSLDHESAFLDETRANVHRHDLSAMVTLLHAPLKTTTVPDQPAETQWYDLAALPPGLCIDLLVVDGPPDPMQPMSRFPALPMLYEQLAPDAVVVVDDVLYPDVKLAVERWVGSFPDLRLSYFPTEKGTAVLRRAAA